MDPFWDPLNTAVYSNQGATQGQRIGTVYTGGTVFSNTGAYVCQAPASNTSTFSPFGGAKKQSATWSSSDGINTDPSSITESLSRRVKPVLFGMRNLLLLRVRWVG